MAKVVYEYRLSMKGFQEIELPVNSKILSVQFQKDGLYLWALVNKEPGKYTQRHIIEMYGTGDDINCEMGVRRNYLATLQSEDNVLHVFEYIGF